MKILQVCNSDFYLSKFLTPLIKSLVEEGYQVECVCEGKNVGSYYEEQNVLVYDFLFPKKNSLLEFFKAIHKMRVLIRNGKYTCVNSHNRNASIIARIAAWLENIPINLYTAHGFYFHDGQSSLAKELTVWIEILLAKITDFTLSQSLEDLQYSIKRGFIKSDKIEHIGNGINTERFTPKANRLELEKELGLNHNKYRICSVGRLVVGKGFSDLLDAFAKFHLEVPESELMIIGGNIAQDISPYHQGFLQKVKEYGLENKVNVTGITNRVEDYLAASDIFVLPSYREGLPRALLEAMSMGLLVIATKIRGCREVIRHGENGYLFSPKDSSELSKLLLSSFQNKDLSLEISQKGHQEILQNYNEKKYIKTQVDLIDKLLKDYREKLS